MAESMRVATAKKYLRSVGDPVAEQGLAEIAARGEYAAKLHGMCYDAQVTLLKDLMTYVLYNDRISDAECSGRCKALKELLNARGQRLNAVHEQMFSFALNSVLQASERLAPPEARVLTP